MSADLMEPLNVLTQSLTPALLGIGGICAAIAIVLAVMRWLVLDVDEPGQRHLKSRIMHVFGFVAGITVIALGGGKLANSLMQNSVSQEISSSGGSSTLPTGVSESTSSYSSLGDLVNSWVDENLEDSTSQTLAAADAAGDGDGNATGEEVVSYQANSMDDAGSSYYESYSVKSAEDAGIDWTKIA